MYRHAAVTHTATSGRLPPGPIPPAVARP